MLPFVRWSDAAYHGDWDTLFQIAARTAWVGSFANCTRLRPKPDLEGSVPVGQPSGYTALHQAAWHGAPVEIAQGLIELGASCMYVHLHPCICIPRRRINHQVV